jgi:hypothetical protein
VSTAPRLLDLRVGDVVWFRDALGHQLSGRVSSVHLDHGYAMVHLHGGARKARVTKRNLIGREPRSPFIEMTECDPGKGFEITGAKD